MDRFDRIYQLHHLLDGLRVPRPLNRLAEDMECSERTVKRTIRYLRDFLHAPIVYDRERNGYHYDQRQGAFELPGLWFNPSELQALLLMQQLLHQVEPGLLDPQLEPMRQRIDQLLQLKHLSGNGLKERIRLISTASRPPGRHFLRLAEALLDEQALHIGYHSRGQDQASERDISPQRLTRYRDNWYLEAWCHLRGNLRLFAIERIEILGPAKTAFRHLTTKALDHAFDDSYGIFSGAPTQTAVLAFSAERARWIAQEQWHPDQQGHWREDGRYEMHIPYSNPTELILDILRYGPDVEVLEPESLRKSVVRRLAEAMDIYRSGRDTE